MDQRKEAEIQNLRNALRKERHRRIRAEQNVMELEACAKADAAAIISQRRRLKEIMDDTALCHEDKVMAVEDLVRTKKEA